MQLLQIILGAIALHIDAGPLCLFTLAPLALKNDALPPHFMVRSRVSLSRSLWDWLIFSARPDTTTLAAGLFFYFSPSGSVLSGKSLGAEEGQSDVFLTKNGFEAAASLTTSVLTRAQYFWMRKITAF